ncbi:MAG: hypothetical protein ACREAK_05615 [Nitrosarchaeum sp.]
MTQKNNTLQRTFAVTFLILAAGMIAIPSLNYAFAEQNSPASSTSSSVIAQDSTIDLILTADSFPASFQPPHNGNVFVVEHTAVPSVLILPVPAGPLGTDCTINDVVVTGKYWRLHNADHSIANFNIPALGDGVTVSFTDGTIVAAQSVTGGATWSDASLHWHEYTTGGVANNAGVPDLSTIGTNWAFQDCGREDNNQGAGNLKSFSDSESFEVAVPVGGTILPIDATSLVVAGLMTQQTGLLAGLAAVGGLSFAVIKFVVLKPKLN